MTGLSNYSIIILAGGLGTRLRPAISDKPKVMATIHEKPFITFLFDQLIAYGARSVILAVGYKGQQVMAKLGHRYRALKLEYSVEPVPLGTGGALRYALPLIDKNAVLVMNGDSFMNADIGSYARWHLKNNYAAALLLTRVKDVSRYGEVKLQNEKIVSFEEKGNHKGAGYINAGVYLFAKSLLTSIPQKEPCSLEYDFFHTLIPHGLYGYCAEGDFIDIGTPETYGRGVHFFKKLSIPH